VIGRYRCWVVPTQQRGRMV